MVQLKENSESEVCPRTERSSDPVDSRPSSVAPLETRVWRSVEELHVPELEHPELKVPSADCVPPAAQASSSWKVSVVESRALRGCPGTCGPGGRSAAVAAAAWNILDTSAESCCEKWPVVGSTHSELPPHAAIARATANRTPFCMTPPLRGAVRAPDDSGRDRAVLRTRGTSHRGSEDWYPSTSGRRRSRARASPCPLGRRGPRPTSALAPDRPARSSRRTCPRALRSRWYPSSAAS